MADDSIRGKRPDQSRTRRSKKEFDDRMNSLNSSYPQLKTKKPASRAASSGEKSHRSDRVSGQRYHSIKPEETDTMARKAGNRASQRQPGHPSAGHSRSVSEGYEAEKEKVTSTRRSSHVAMETGRTEGRSATTSRGSGKAEHRAGTPAREARRAQGRSGTVRTTSEKVTRRANTTSSGKETAVRKSREWQRGLVPRNSDDVRREEQSARKISVLDVQAARAAWTEQDEINFRERENNRIEQKAARVNQRRKEVRIRTVSIITAIVVIVLLGVFAIRGLVSHFSSTSASQETAAASIEGTSSLSTSEDSSVDQATRDAIIAASSFSGSQVANDGDTSSGESASRKMKFDARLDQTITSGSRTKTDGVQVGIAWTGNMINDSIPAIELMFYQAISQAGGEPVLLGQVTDEASAIAALDTIDCLVVCGGGDIDPTIYGETVGPYFEGPAKESRDTSDYWILDVAVRSNIPVMAVCRGMQMLNIVYGGSLVQDISHEIGTSVLHRNESATDYTNHDITIVQNTLLWSLEQTDRKTVNSFHHECVKELGEGLTISAAADDGVVEAIEDDSKTFVLGLQYHPERSLQNGETSYLIYFQSLIAAAS